MPAKQIPTFTYNNEPLGASEAGLTEVCIPRFVARLSDQHCDSGVNLRRCCLGARGTGGKWAVLDAAGSKGALRRDP